MTARTAAPGRQPAPLAGAAGDPLRIALLVFVAALAIRALLALVLGPVAPLSDDQADYFSLAHALRALHRYVDPRTGAPTAFRDPAYPLFLALVGGTPQATWLAQSVVSSAPGAFLVLAAADAAGIACAWVTGALFLLCLGFASYSFLAYSETLAVACLALLLWSLGRIRAGAHGIHVGVAAVALAGALLTRAAIGIAAAAMFVAIAWDARAARRRLALAAFLGLLPVCAWIARNDRVLGVPTPNTNSVVNVYLGNNPRTPIQHGYRAMNDSLVWLPLLRHPEAARPCVAAGLVADYVRRNPARATLGMLARIPDALESDRIFIGVARRGQFPQRRARDLMLLGVFFILATLPVAALALAGALRPGSGVLSRVALAALGGSLAVQVVSIAHSRFTLPGLMLAVPAAATQLLSIRAGNRTALLQALAVLALLTAIAAREFLFP